MSMVGPTTFDQDETYRRPVGGVGSAVGAFQYLWLSLTPSISPSMATSRDCIDIPRAACLSRAPRWYRALDSRHDPCCLVSACTLGLPRPGIAKTGRIAVRGAVLDGAHVSMPTPSRFVVPEEDRMYRRRGSGAEDVVSWSGALTAVPNCPRWLPKMRHIDFPPGACLTLPDDNPSRPRRSCGVCPRHPSHTVDVGLVEHSVRKDEARRLPSIGDGSLTCNGWVRAPAAATDRQHDSLDIHPRRRLPAASLSAPTKCPYANTGRIAAPEAACSHAAMVALGDTLRVRRPCARSTPSRRLYPVPSTSSPRGLVRPSGQQRRDVSRSRERREAPLHV
ncbi:hypothetical protein GLOTRDRAFT_133262 [Gloeophyllum trabeum ATCC 11539]|uniref:Uncharacterized protein n=1 Tax=Gloeophyllum trabeum (strain ATCC 11539 / FP-39264 / Madison 617) TaxID=670483 RepID=S7RAW5_GLOTA|nr:uncharacterized protein GLOTRDRAFT_133262 [Gloeophyllum trabeum ATCC 11539]EPQ51400.1 hypothetical protein GLOTRDRAFT_133262 [Gloeophyllum trabeum ATCC 11539]